jgi:hypothetical protein
MQRQRPRLPLHPVTSKSFDRSMDRVSRIMALGFAVPCFTYGMASNPAALPIGLLLLRHASGTGFEVTAVPSLLREIRKLRSSEVRTSPATEVKPSLERPKRKPAARLNGGSESGTKAA